MFDWLRKKIVEIDVPLGDGKTRTVTVSQKKFDRWVKKGYLSQRVTVNAIDDGAASGVEVFLNPAAYPLRKVTWQWKIGKDIDQATYDRLKDSEGNLYALTCFEEGVKKIGCLTKAQYDEACRKLGV